MGGATVGYVVAIIFIVLALNLYLTFKRIGKNNKRIRKSRLLLDEEKQAVWRYKEIARRLAREQDDALERIKLRNETIALYDEVRRRHEGDDLNTENVANPENPAETPEKPIIPAESGRLRDFTDENNPS